MDTRDTVPGMLRSRFGVVPSAFETMVLVAAFLEAARDLDSQAIRADRAVDPIAVPAAI